jgi:hypothetical protein
MSKILAGFWDMAYSVPGMVQNQDGIVHLKAEHVEA